MNTPTLLHISTHQGKMKGFHSLGTSRRNNPYCLHRCKNSTTVCKKCYAERYINMRKNLEKCLERNTKLLTEGIIPRDDLPRILDRYFRLESFGDLINETHFENYLNICEKNPETMFALWTKNPFIIERVFEYRNKPENLVINLSSLRINKPWNVKIWDWVDHVFTVYDKKGADKINCPHALDKNIKCVDCLKCYKKGTEFWINEKLK